MAKKRTLYDAGVPADDFNELVLSWLDGSATVREHATPAAFDQLRGAYDKARGALEETGLSALEAHTELLSGLTEIIMGDDLSGVLSSRLSAATINTAGVRSALAQGFVKNTGENFINLLTYALADLLSGQDEILVDKGTPTPLKPYLTMARVFQPAGGQPRTVEIKIECDVAVWSRSDPKNAIVVSAKTRLKEVFHIGTMWKLLYDCLGDPHCLSKWGLTGPPETPDMLYVFATADMIPKGGTKTQGPDVERDTPRNLIAMDASFFDYVFVSKTGISHVSDSLSLSLYPRREALFHELGCILTLVEQRFGIELG